MSAAAEGRIAKRLSPREFAEADKAAGDRLWRLGGQPAMKVSTR